MKKHNRTLIISLLIITVLITVIISGYSYLDYQKKQEEKVLIDRQAMNTNNKPKDIAINAFKLINVQKDFKGIELFLSYKEKDLKQSIDEANASIKTQEKDLTYAIKSLSELDSMISGLENAEESEKGLLCNQLRTALDEAKLQLDDVKSRNKSIEEAHKQMIEDASSINSYIGLLLKDVKSQIGNIEVVDCKSAYEKHDKLIEKTDKTCDSILQELDDIKVHLDNMKAIYASAYETYNGLDEALSEFEEYEAMKKDLKQKLSSLSISYSMDMSIPLGLTSEQLAYLLEQYGLIKNEDILQNLPQIMPNTVQEHPINELLSIAVICLESGYGTSYLAVNNHNYAGLMRNGKGQYFETAEKGIEAAIKCLHRNLKGDNTVYAINSTYCPPADENDYHWSNMAISIMRELASIDIPVFETE